MRDYTLDSYIQICKYLKSRNSEFLTVSDVIRAQELDKNTICMRHDVDRLPLNALKMAKAENTLGIRSTYYFRKKIFIFKPRFICQIESLGHEVGYHYEVMSESFGSKEKAKKIFERNLRTFRKYCRVETVCMHGAPLSKYDNLDFWKHFSFEEFDLLGDPFLSINFKSQGMEYFTDTGRSWGQRGINLRDKIANSANQSINSTKDLIGFLKKNDTFPVMIQTHPERWPFNLKRYYFSKAWDSLTNKVKFLLKNLRSRG